MQLIRRFDLNVAGAKEQDVERAVSHAAVSRFGEQQAAAAGAVLA